MPDHVGMMEKEIQLFFHSKILFYLSLFCFLYFNDFLMVLKPRRVSDYVINNCFWNCQESEERETKTHDLGKFFHIQNFRTFGSLIIFGSYSNLFLEVILTCLRETIWRCCLVQMFPVNYQCFRSDTTF